MKTRILLKLARAEGRKNIRERYDISKLQSQEIRLGGMTLKGGILRFETLGDIDDAEEEHDMILAKKVLGRSKKLSRPWI